MYSYRLITEKEKAETTTSNNYRVENDGVLIIETEDEKQAIAIVETMNGSNFFDVIEKFLRVSNE